MIKIIGIDPGLSATGIGIVSGAGLKVDHFSFGSINTSKDLSLPNRLEKIFSNILSVLQDEKPDLMIVEDVFSAAKFPKAGIVLGKVIGVVLLAGCQAEVPVAEVSVREAKQILTGNGNATKKQLEKAILGTGKGDKPMDKEGLEDAAKGALKGILGQ